MLKRITVLLASILIITSVSVDAYTVVLKKNGKTMTGKLVSENETSIVFRDDTGLQYSLKKSALDLEKMAQANTPPPAAPVEPQAPAAAPGAPAATPSAPAPAAEESKKPARVYTAADLQDLREKYANIDSSSSSGGGFTNPTESPEAYYRALLEAVASITDSINNLGGLVDGMNTAWEVASSTGRDPKGALGTYKSAAAYNDTLKGVNGILSDLQSLHASMSKPPSDGLKQGYDALTTALSALQDYEEAVRTFDGTTAVADFRSRTNGYANKVDSAILQIQKVQAPAGAVPNEPPQQ